MDQVGEAEKPVKPSLPRKPWLAGLLSLFVPGLGFLYVGMPAAAVAIASLLSLLTASWLVAASGLGLPLVPALYAFAAIVIAVRIAVVAGSAFAAHRAGPGYQARRCNSVLAYVGLALFALVLSRGTSWITRTQVVEVFRIPADSMLPTLVVGDHVVAAKLRSRDRNPARGEIVVFRAGDRPQSYVKRVVGLENDEVAIVGGHLRVNGQLASSAPLGKAAFLAGPDRSARVELELFRESLLGSSYDVARDPDRPATDFAPVVVPPGHVFLIGDNRDNSLDSRSIGPVPLDHVQGRLDGILWSWDETGLHADRIGLRL